MVKTTNIWFEQIEPVRLFDHTLDLCDEILAYAELLEKKLGVPCCQKNTVSSLPMNANRIPDVHLPENYGKNAIRYRNEDADKKLCDGNCYWICLKCKILLYQKMYQKTFKLFHTQIK